MKVLFVSTYPPERCGIATYTRNLAHALNEVDYMEVKAACIAVENFTHIHNAYSKLQPDVDYTVVRAIRRNDLKSYMRTARRVNDSDFDVVHVQHEFGLFGGEAGRYILDFFESLEKPSVVTFHALPSNPSGIAEKVISALAERSTKVITHTLTGANLLSYRYNVDKDKVWVIPHGVPDIDLSRIDRESIKEKLAIAGFPVMVNFGLLRSQKGIEYAIKAMPQVVREYPDALLLLLGQTHPKTNAKEGEGYRNQLKRLVESLGLERNVIFIDRFLEEEKLIEHLVSADIYIIPYPNGEQILSGTMAYALACGKAVITTPFCHAREAIGNLGGLNETAACGDIYIGSRGILVPFSNAEAIGRAVTLLAKNRALRASIERNALNYAKECTWRKVALRHFRLYESILCKHTAEVVEAQLISKPYPRILCKHTAEVVEAQLISKPYPRRAFYAASPFEGNANMSYAAKIDSSEPRS